MSRGSAPPGEVRAPNRKTGRGAEVETLGGDRTSAIFAHPPDNWPRCDVAGVYCAVLGIPQLIAAGNAKVCCRHYFETEVA